MVNMKSDKRGKKCEIRVSASEKQKIQELASELGLSVSATVRQILIQKHFSSNNQEIYSLFGQIRDTLFAISQTLSNLNGSNLNNPTVKQLQIDVQELKKTIAAMEKKF